jgi:hypothetical protein
MSVTSGFSALACAKLDEVVSTPQRADLVETALRPPGSAEGDVPRVGDGNAVTLRTRAIDDLSEARDELFGAAAHELLKVLRRDLAETPGGPSRAEAHAPHHLTMELELSVRRRPVDGDGASRAHHPAADVEPNRSHRERPLVPIGEDHATDGHAVAVVDVRRDGDELHPGEAGRVNDLAIQLGLGLIQQTLAEKETDRHTLGVAGREIEEAPRVVPVGVGLPSRVVEEVLALHGWQRRRPACGADGCKLGATTC